jgi:tetratricopeptide (TPR) repeat protein
MNHALAHQDRLPFTERYLTKAGNASALGDHATAIGVYRTLLGRYPDDVRALNNLGWEYGELRQYAMEDSLLTRAAAIDSSIPAIWTGIVVTRVNLGNFDGARQVLDHVERRFPGMHLARLAEIYLAAGQQDWETAERKARERIAAAPGDSLDALDSYETMAGIVMTQGRLAEGERYSREVVGMAVPLASPARYYSSALRLAYLELRYRHASEPAIAVVENALRRFPLDSLREGDRPYDDLARFFAAAGKPERARDLIAQAERTTLDRLQVHKPNRHWSHGVVALAERRFGEAETELRAAADSSDCAICVLPDLARLYQGWEKPDSEIAVYERYVGTPWEWRFETDAFELGRATERLAQLYQQRGDTVKAAAAYDRLVRLWNRADPELQPEVTAARRWLATQQARVSGRTD